MSQLQRRGRQQIQWVKSSLALSSREKFFWSFPRMGQDLGQNRGRENEPPQKVQKAKEIRRFHWKTAGNCNIQTL